MKERFDEKNLCMWPDFCNVACEEGGQNVYICPTDKLNCARCFVLEEKGFRQPFAVNSRVASQMTLPMK